MIRYAIYFQPTDGSRNGAYASTIYGDKVRANEDAYRCNWADKGKTDYQVREVLLKDTNV